MVIYSIYKATNKINGKSYIGFTNHFHRRLVRHKSDSKNKTNKFYAAIRKHGWYNFEWEVIYQSKDSHYCLNVMENYFIIEYDSYKNGYNETLGGNGMLGRTYKHKKSSREKMSLSHKGKSPWNKGKTGVYSTEFLQEKSKNTVFRTLKKTDNHKSNIAKALQGKKKSESHIKNAAAARSKEYKMLNPEGKIVVIKNMSEYCRNHGLNQGCMIGVFRGRYGYKSHKGYTKYNESQ